MPNIIFAVISMMSIAAMQATLVFGHPGAAAPDAAPTAVSAQAADAEAAPAIPEDLSALSYEELVTLRDQLNLAMWQSDVWQEVTVPQGAWEVGVDIPAGHWTVKPTPGNWATVAYGTKLDASGHDLASRIYYAQVIDPACSIYKDGSDMVSTSIDVKDGHYIVIDYGSVVFSPYAGKPDLGFQ